MSSPANTPKLHPATLTLTYDAPGQERQHNAFFAVRGRNCMHVRGLVYDMLRKRYGEGCRFHAGSKVAWLTEDEATYTGL
jgi:hypothetical protein